MSKKTKLRDAKEDTVVRAAVISRRGPIIAAAITTAGAILIGSLTWLNERSRKTSILSNEKFVGRIVDKNTGVPIRQAKVHLETADVPAVAFSDSEGVFSFSTSNPSSEIILRVEAEGYEDYSLRIVPSKNQGIQEIGLSSKRMALLSKTPSEPAELKSAVSQQSVNPKSESSVTEGLLRIRGRVEDAETGKPLVGARVMVVGFPGEAMITGTDGEFDLNSHRPRNETFRLRAERDGYSSQERWHEAGNERATIRLTRE